MSSTNEKKIWGLPARLVYIAGALLFAAPIINLVKSLGSLLGLGKTQYQQTVEARNQIDREVQSSGLQIDPTKVEADGASMGHHLGTAYGWYDPRSWTEDERSAIALVREYDSRTFPLLEASYRIQISRTLRTDLQRAFCPRCCRAGGYPRPRRKPRQSFRWRTQVKHA